MKEFTEEQFEEFVGEILPQQLFHVMSTDIDDETGAKCEDIILLQMLGSCPEALRYKSLRWFIDYFNLK